MPYSLLRVMRLLGCSFAFQQLLYRFYVAAATNPEEIVSQFLHTYLHESHKARAELTLIDASTER